MLDTCTGAVDAVVTDMPEPPIRSNLSSIDLLPAPGSFNYRIDVEPFEEGVAPGTSYSLAVIDRAKDARAIVRIYDKAGIGTLDTVTYSAIDVAAEPTLGVRSEKTLSFRDCLRLVRSEGTTVQ